MRSARAQFYPNVNLTAFLGLSTLGLGRLIDMGSEQWGVGPAIKLPIFDDSGAPMHEGGVVTGQPGMYFVGLNFLYSMSSSMIHGVGRDAERITAHLATARGLV